MPHDSTMQDEESLPFEVNDTPAMKALGYYREETK